MNNFMNTLMIPVYFSSEYICTYIFPIFYHGKVVSVSIIYYKVPNLTEILPCWTVETICPSVYEIIGTTAVPSDALMFCRNDFNKETCIS